MSRTVAIIGAVVVLVGSTLACSLPRVPAINIRVPQLEIGELRDERTSVPLPDADSVEAEVLFGAGELTVGAGASAGDLLSAHFVYNIDKWKPEVTYENGKLTVKQGGDQNAWGVPSGNVEDVRNEWELAFSSEIPLNMRVATGAGEGKLNMTGLQLTALKVEVGAGDFTLDFNEPNRATMESLTVNAGASKLVVNGIGNASPQTVKVQGGAGDITLGFNGAWSRSSDVQVTAGIGSVELHLPLDVGVQVEMKGAVTNLDAPGFTQQGNNVYTNEAFGQAATELHIEITMGIGDVRLVTE